MGEYTSADGVRVRYTDAQTFQLASDLFQYVEHDYKGSVSIDARRLEDILKMLQSGSPLGEGEWNILTSIRRSVGTGFDQWRKSGRDGQNADVPAGSGRISEATTLVSPSTLRRAREQYAAPSTTAKDKATTAPHLLDTVLHDLAHTHQHIARLMDADVKRSPQSIAFNAEHALHHAKSAQEHAHKLDQHLAAAGSDPKTWATERRRLHEMRAVQEAQVGAATHESTVCVDFDGVIHQGPHGTPGKVEGTLVDGAVQGLKDLAAKYKLILLTARDDLNAVRVWLEAQGVLQYFVDVTNVKPPAVAYLDDRGVHFSNWPAALKALDPHAA